MKSFKERILAELKSEIRSYGLAVKRSNHNVKMQIARLRRLNCNLSQIDIIISSLKFKIDFIKPFQEATMSEPDASADEQRRMFIELEGLQKRKNACEGGIMAIEKKIEFSNIVIDAENAYMKWLKRHISVLKKRTRELRSEAA